MTFVPGTLTSRRTLCPDASRPGPCLEEEGRGHEPQSLLALTVTLSSAQVVFNAVLPSVWLDARAWWQPVRGARHVSHCKQGTPKGPVLTCKERRAQLGKVSVSIHGEARTVPAPPEAVHLLLGLGPLRAVCVTGSTVAA